MSNEAMLEVDPILELKKENQMLTEELNALKEELLKATKQDEMKESVINRLSEEIKFLEGQIEAYKYCMNCKR